MIEGDKDRDIPVLAILMKPSGTDTASSANGVFTLRDDGPASAFALALAVALLDPWESEIESSVVISSRACLWDVSTASLISAL